MLRTYDKTMMRPEDLHPHDIFDKERRLAKEFVMNHPGGAKIDPCPCSGCARDEVLFSKWGQQYAICPETWNLSLADIPRPDVLHEYFVTSELAVYRASDEYQRMATGLRLDLWRKQWEWIETMIYKFLGRSSVSLTGWGVTFQGWVDLLESMDAIKELGIEEPLPPVDEKSLGHACDVVCLNDTFQREAEPRDLLGRVHSTLNMGGLLLLSCRSGSGFDILTLREHSDSVFPFDHVCLPSPRGMEMLLEESGFDVLDISTPGMLDIRLVGRGEIPRDQYFQRYLLNSLRDDEYDAFQVALQRFKLSSHMRVVARKVC